MSEIVENRVRVLAELITETGYRLPELLKLEWRDVNLAEGVIRDPYDGLWVRLSRGAMRLLLDVLLSSEPPFYAYIFVDAATGGKPMSMDAAYRLFRKRGLNVGKLRQVYASRMQDWIDEACDWRDICIERSEYKRGMR